MNMEDNLGIPGQETESPRSNTPTNQDKQPKESPASFLVRNSGPENARRKDQPGDSGDFIISDSMTSEIKTYFGEFVNDLAESPGDDSVTITEFRSVTQDHAFILWCITDRELELPESSTDQDHKNPWVMEVNELKTTAETTDAGIAKDQLSNIANFIKEEWNKVIKDATDDLPADNLRTAGRKERMDRLRKCNRCIAFRTVPTEDEKGWKWDRWPLVASTRTVAPKKEEEEVLLQAETLQGYKFPLNFWIHAAREEALASKLAEYTPYFDDLWKKHKDLQVLRNLEPKFDENGVDGKGIAKNRAKHDLQKKQHAIKIQIAEKALLTSGYKVKEVFEECFNISLPMSYKFSTIQLSFQPEVKPGEEANYQRYDSKGGTKNYAVAGSPKITADNVHIKFSVNDAEPVARPSGARLLDLFVTNEDPNFQTYLKDLLEISDKK